MFTFLLIIFIIVVILLIPTILMQSGSGAQSGMFGNDMTMGAFGAKTSEVLVKFTQWLVGIFMILALILGYLRIQETKSLMRKNQPVPAEQTPAGTTPSQLIAPTNIETNVQGQQKDVQGTATQK